MVGGWMMQLEFGLSQGCLTGYALKACGEHLKIPVFMLYYSIYVTFKSRQTSRKHKELNKKATQFFKWAK